MNEKVNFVKQEIVGDAAIEGSRRRFSMLVEGVTDPRFFLAAVSDFLYTIISTMETDWRLVSTTAHYNDVLGFLLG